MLKTLHATPLGKSTSIEATDIYPIASADGPDVPNQTLNIPKHSKLVTCPPSHKKQKCLDTMV